MPNDPVSAPSVLSLSEADAQARLKTEGYNELPRPDQRTPLRIILEVVREPMLALLLGGGVIYLALGDLKEALILLAFATMSVVITVVQETRTERVLEALRDLTSPRALVIRDGERKRIAGRQVVRGDFVVLAEGDRVPADAVLVQSDDLQTDELLLTGESIPVRKIARDPGVPFTPRRPGGDDLPNVFSGSMIVRGTGIGEVIAIGSRSEIGKIGHSLSTLQTEPPRLQAQTRQLVRVFAMVGGAVSILAVLLYGTLRGGWLDAVLAGIALGMSMLPEEFPVVLTVFMAMGAWRISQAHVLTRRAAAIETLGSATVLCTDKTGTLTENRMSIAELRLKNGEIARPGGGASAMVPESFHDLVEFGILASALVPFDPMEKAFHELGREQLTTTEYMHGPEWRLVHAYGLRPDLLAMTHVWQTGNGAQEFVVAAKGAPEAIADLCRLSGQDRDALKQSLDAMAGEGLRVLGVARASFSGRAWPDSQSDFAFAIAALLHDSAEDQGGAARLEDVRNRFGARVARIVEACSDSLANTAAGERKPHWRERKEKYITHLRVADDDILRVSLADKVHNARAILRDLRKPEVGKEIWNRFSQPREQTLWYYRSLADLFCDVRPDQLANELSEIVSVLEQA